MRVQLLDLEVGVYDEPDVRSRLIAKVGAGAEVEITRHLQVAGKDWSEVKYGESTGYIGGDTKVEVIAETRVSSLVPDEQRVRFRQPEPPKAEWLTERRILGLVLIVVGGGAFFYSAQSPTMTGDLGWPLLVGGFVLAVVGAGALSGKRRG